MTSSEWHYSTTAGTSNSTEVSWRVWTDSGTCSNTDHVWPIWATQTTNGTGSSYSDQTWEVWNDKHQRLVIRRTAREWETKVESALEKEGRLERERRQAEEKKEREKKRVAAEKKALQLLRTLIGAWAYRRFRKQGYHEIVGQSGTRYRLVPGKMIVVMADQTSQQISHRLCSHHDSSIPPTDTLVTQLLMILSGKEGEASLQKVANRHAA